MSNAERVRKQVYELTAEDLNNHPLWQFCPEEEGKEGQDEATVKPAIESEVPGYSPGAYILASDVLFADGATGVGYIYSGEPHDFGCTQPNNIVPSGQVSFWLGWLRFLKNPAPPIAAAISRLNKDVATVFSIQFRTLPHINGAPMELTVKRLHGKRSRSKVYRTQLRRSTWLILSSPALMLRHD